MLIPVHAQLGKLAFENQCFKCLMNISYTIYITSLYYSITLLMHVEWIGIETVFVSHLESQDYVQILEFFSVLTLNGHPPVMLYRVANGLPMVH